MALYLTINIDRGKSINNILENLMTRWAICIHSKNQKGMQQTQPSLFHKETQFQTMCYYSSAQQCLLTQLEGCCCKIQQCSVSPSYNALLQKQQFAPIHHHIMLCFTICCTTIHCFVAPSYNIPYYTPLQGSFASTYKSLLHPYKIHCCTLLQCSVAPSCKSLSPHHTMPCCIMIQWSVLHNHTMHCWTIIQCSATSSFNSLLHHLTMLCCTNYNALLHLHKMYCCIITQFIVASSHCCVPPHTPSYYAWL